MIEHSSAKTMPGAATSLPISVVIPVYNRSVQLRTLLEALGRQAFPGGQFEVIVCDDGSTEDLGPVVKDAAAFGLDVVHLRQENRGQAAAMNFGMAHARGGVVVTTDSDCVPDTGWLEAVGRTFDDPGVALAGGPIGYRGARHLSGRCVGFLMTSMLGAGGATDPRCPVRIDYYPCSGNLAVRRDLALIVGGFPDLPYQLDTEFCDAIGRLGHRPQFMADAVVLHDERSSLWSIFRENFLKGACRSRGPRGPRMGQLLPALPALLVLYLVALVIASVLAPPAAAVMVPGLAVYAAALGALAVQGWLDLREPQAAFAIPVYALVMHLGYGCGYLAARLGQA